MLYVVLSMCSSLPKVVTDCLGNRRTLMEGREVATAASRPLARVWNAIFACCEDALLQELDGMLTWGPAHTSWASSAQGYGRMVSRSQLWTGAPTELPTLLPSWLRGGTGHQHT